MKLNKPYNNQEYADLAVFCNQNGMIIEDKGDYLESVLPPEPTIEEKQASVRAVRNGYLQATDIYMIADYPITDKQREEYITYRQYLRDYTDDENWWEHNPMTFEEWKYIIQDSSDELDNSQNQEYNNNILTL